jgi:hypothetical protein
MRTSIRAAQACHERAGRLERSGGSFSRLDFITECESQVALEGVYGIER